MNIVKKKKFGKKFLFYCCLIALPLSQFVVFYLYVNFNSLILSFVEFDQTTGTQKFAYFDNFKTIYYDFFSSELSYNFTLRIKNSLLFWAFSLIIGTNGAIIFAYYIFKKGLFSGVFKIFLFLPSIVPGIALVSIYSNIMVSGAILLDLPSFKIDDKVGFPVVLGYCLFMGFGTQVMMYLGAMNKINPSISEAAMLDGVGFFRELWSIVLPCVYSTITTFIVVGLTVIFSSDMSLYSFYSTNAPGGSQTLGYYLNREIQTNSTNRAAWPKLAAIGMCFTVILSPITIVIKSYLDKKDPLA